MYDAETRALRRAVVLLLLVSAVRWAWTTHADESSDRLADSVLPELTAAATRARSDDERRLRPLGASEKIDPNRAAEAELDRLPGVGPSTARAIVAARDSGTVFRRPEDLLSVRGVGPGLLARIHAHVDLGSPPRAIRGNRALPPGAVDINRASVEELRTLPGVGPAIAERILLRRAERRFESVEELLEVKGIGATTLEWLRSRATVVGSR